MSAQNDGGQAFPMSGFVDGNGNVHNHPEFGMSLRDHFAAQAIGQIIETCKSDTASQVANPPRYFAERAYEIADAMLAARVPAGTTKPGVTIPRWWEDGADAPEAVLPVPRLQLRWLNHGLCRYEMILPLGEHDIRREGEEGEYVRKAMTVILGQTRRRGSDRPPLMFDKNGTEQVDTPYRDGAHIKWDAERLGMPAYAVWGERSTLITTTPATPDPLALNRELGDAWNDARDAVAKFLRDWDELGSVGLEPLRAIVARPPIASPRRDALAVCVEALHSAADRMAHIAEYWNGDSNESAMSDACSHTIDEAAAGEKAARAALAQANAVLGTPKENTK